MSVTEKLMEVIEEVLDEREKEVVLSYLDNADEIDFDNFWNTKNSKIIGKKGLTNYVCREPRRTYFQPMHESTARYRLKSAFKKLEKSPKLRAIGYTL